jgi:hypothetical protein
VAVRQHVLPQPVHDVGLHDGVRLAQHRLYLVEARGGVGVGGGRVGGGDRRSGGSGRVRLVFRVFVIEGRIFGTGVLELGELTRALLHGGDVHRLVLSGAGHAAGHRL